MMLIWSAFDTNITRQLHNEPKLSYLILLVRDPVNLRTKPCLSVRTSAMQLNSERGCGHLIAHFASKPHSFWTALARSLKLHKNHFCTTIETWIYEVAFRVSDISAQLDDCREASSTIWPELLHIISISFPFHCKKIVLRPLFNLFFSHCNICFPTTIFYFCMMYKLFLFSWCISCFTNFSELTKHNFHGTLHESYLKLQVLLTKFLKP